MWSILFKTTPKFLQIHKKSKFHKQARVWLQPGQRQKQNLNRENLLGRQQPYQCTKEDGLTLNHQNKISIRTISRRKSSIFFDTIKRYIEKVIEQLNFARSSFIFEIIIHKYRIGLMIDGKLVWLQEEEACRQQAAADSRGSRTCVTEVPLYCDDPVNQDLLLQQDGERIEKLVTTR